MKSIDFQLYRYQLLPITRHVQINLFHDIKSVEDIEKNKNRYLYDILTKFPKLRHRVLKLNQKEIFSKGDIFCIKVGAHKL